MPKCEHCGSEYAIDSDEPTVCPGCGASIVDAAEDTDSAERNEPRADHDAIRAKFARAAQLLAAQQTADDTDEELPLIEAAPDITVESLATVSSDDLPVVDDLSDRSLELPRLDPLFGLSPIQSAILPDDAAPDPERTTEREAPAASGWLAPVVAGLLATLGAGVSFWLAATMWWSPGRMLLGGIIAALAAAAVGVFVGELATARRKALVLTVVTSVALPAVEVAAWSSSDFRGVVFDHAGHGDFEFLKNAFADPAPAVAARACRAGIANSVFRPWFVRQLSGRPALVHGCIPAAREQWQRDAARFLAKHWKARINTGGADACDFVEPYAALPVAEEEKFQELFACSFAGPAAPQSCCGAAVRRKYGQASDLVPALNLTASVYPTAETLDGVLSPILHPKSLSGDAAQNAARLGLHSSEVVDAALSATCDLLDSKAWSTAIQHLSALADTHCSGQKIPGSNHQLWTDACVAAAGEPVDENPTEKLCGGIEDAHFVEAMETAQSIVRGALHRGGRERIRGGILASTPLVRNETTRRIAERERARQSEETAPIRPGESWESFQRRLRRHRERQKEKAWEAKTHKELGGHAGEAILRGVARQPGG